MVLRHLCRPRDPCGAEIKAGAVSINDALALSIAELDRVIPLFFVDPDKIYIVPVNRTLNEPVSSHFVVSTISSNSNKESDMDLLTFCKKNSYDD